MRVPAAARTGYCCQGVHDVTRTVCLAVLLIGLSPAAVRADEAPRVLVFPAEGKVTGKLGKAPAAITAAVADAAKRSGARAEVAKGSIADAMALAGCEASDPSCLSQVAATMDADLVVSISVAPADTGVFVDVDVGKRGATEPTRGNWILDGASVAAIQAAAGREADGLFSGKSAAEPATAPAAPAEPESKLEVPADAGPAPSAKQEDDRPGRLGRVRWYAWGATAAGAALMVGGAVMLKGAGSKQDDIDAAETSSLSDFRELESLEDDAASQALWGDILLGAGVVAAGVGVTLIVLEMKSSPDEAETTVSIAPAALDHGFGLTLLGDL